MMALIKDLVIYKPRKLNKHGHGKAAWGNIQKYDHVKHLNVESATQLIDLEPDFVQDEQVEDELHDNLELTDHQKSLRVKRYDIFIKTDEDFPELD